MIPLGCVTGRFQPVHGQHVGLFGVALAACRHLIVAVTNPDATARAEEPTSAHRHTTEANPFTYYERARLLMAALRHRGMADRATIVPFDLTRPERWPDYVPLAARHFVRAHSDWERSKAARFTQAGYDVTLLTADPATRLSATEIRASLAAGSDDWRALAAPGTACLLDRFVADRPMPARQ